MGCAASKINNEDIVCRCKERRRLIKDAVFARHHLAGAHSDYSHSFRLTGSALSSFASHEPLPVSISISTPAALLRRPSFIPVYAPSSTPIDATPPPHPSTASATSSFMAPPCAPSTSPPVKRLHNNPSRSTDNARNKSVKFKVKLLHILSESSPNSSLPLGATSSSFTTVYIIHNKGNGKSNRDDDYDYESTYARTSLKKWTYNLVS